MSRDHKIDDYYNNNYYNSNRNSAVQQLSVLYKSIITSISHPY